MPDTKIWFEIRSLVHKQIGAFASLGGIVQGKGMTPKTRLGKTLRRFLGELAENIGLGKFTKEVALPSTVEDGVMANVSPAKVEEYFEKSGGKHEVIEGKGKS